VGFEGKSKDFEKFFIESLDLDFDLFRGKERKIWYNKTYE